MPSPPFTSNQEFNNADSFAQAFDTAWQSLGSTPSAQSLSTSEKLESVLEKVHHHPFMITCPSIAREVGEFRIRLLGL